MNEQVIIVGASGHGKVVADIIQKSGDTVVGFLDDNPNLPEKLAGFPVLGTIEKHKLYKKYKFVIAIGNSEIRERIVSNLLNVEWYTAIHPSAAISGIDVSIGEGTVVMANTVINSGAVIGKHCIINSGAIVEHDCQIQDFVHVSVGAKIAGTVTVGKNTWIGIGASVKNNLSLCENCMIGAGAVVVKNIDEEGMYVGVPAERILMEKIKEFGGVSSSRLIKTNMRLSADAQHRRAV